MKYHLYSMIFSQYRQKIALLGALIYTIIIGIGMYISYDIKGISYENPQIMNTLWWVEVILTLWTIFLTMKFFSWKEIGFVRLDKKQIWWFVPSLVIVFTMLIAQLYAFYTINLSALQIRQIGLIGFATLLVGFSEELMYRGIIFNTFLKTHSKLKTVLISAVAFSLLHSVNILGGLPLSTMLIQLLMTFVFGLFSALIFMRIKSILPLILFHWLWDFCLISNRIINGESLISKISSIYVLLQLILLIVLFVFLEKVKIKSNDLAK